MDSTVQTLATGITFVDNNFAASLSGLGTAMTITSLIGTFIIGFSMLPQTIMTLRLKLTAKLSLAFYFISGVATFLLMIYGIALAVVPINGANANEVRVLDLVGGVGGPNSFIQFTLASNADANLANIIKSGGIADPNNSNVYNVSTLLPLVNLVVTANGGQLPANFTGGELTLANIIERVAGEAKNNVVLGFTLPGAAVIFGEALVAITSFLISWQKFANMMAAKKAGMSELQYEEQFLLPHANKMMSKGKM